MPAFTGLGAPHWQQNAQGMIYGISRRTTKGHFARAALESIAFQSYDVIKAMEKDTGIKIENLRVDGGASANNLLMQFQADILNSNVERPKILETTSLGIAYMAGLNIGFWDNIDEIKEQWKLEREFVPEMSEVDRKSLSGNWNKVIKKSF